VSAAREQKIREVYADFNESGVEGLVAHVSSSFVLTTPAELASEPGTYEGPDGLRRYFESFDGVMEEMRTEPTGRFSHAGDWTVAELLAHGRGRGSGIEIDQVLFARIRFDGDELAELTFDPSWDEAVAELERLAG
jgi:hypothetical protein